MKLNELRESLAIKSWDLCDLDIRESQHDAIFNKGFDAGSAAVIQEAIKLIGELKQEIHSHNCPKFSNCRLCDKIKRADNQLADWQRFIGNKNKGE